MTACAGDTNGASFLLKECECKFARYHLMNRTCIVVFEESGITSNGEAFLKSLLGGDVITAQRKHVHMTYQFTHKGIVIITSHLAPEDAFKRLMPLLNRFFCVNLKYVPDEANPTLNDELKQHLPAILNWVLALKQENLSKLVRTKQFNTLANLESSDLGQWIVSSVAYQEGALTSIENLFTHYKE